MDFIKTLTRISLIPRLCPLAAIESAKPVYEQYDWQATSGDPQFLVELRLPLLGWYMLEVDIQHDQHSADVRLYLDMGDGFSEGNAFFLPLKNGRLTKRLVYIAKGVKALRFDPMESPGLFTVRDVTLSWLTPWFAKKRLVNRLLNMHHRFRELNSKNVWHTIADEALEMGMLKGDYARLLYDETFNKRPLQEGYLGWIDNEVLSQPSVEEWKNNLQVWAVKPLISIILPTYNTSPKFLKACIDSVLAQSYEDWQLCIADDASSNAEVRVVLEHYTAADKRICTEFRNDNGHISAASNSALEQVAGAYVALLDHDDCLVQHALYRVVETLNLHPQARLLYSDEDKIDHDGRRFDPHFKPDWNYDLLLGQNYITHLTVLDTALVKQVGGFKKGVEGSQDHDLLLRCIPHLASEEIIHIPHILYHWRAVEGSTALDGTQKNYSAEAGLRAVSEYLEEISPNAKVVSGPGMNSYRVKWPLPEEPPLVTLLIPTRDGIEILRPCVDALLERTDYPHFEVIILDNQSTCRETLAYMADVESDARVRILRWNHQFNYSAINNFGVEHAHGSVIGLINNDIEPINNNWLTEMVSQVCRDEIGCVGAKLYYPNDTIQHGGVILGLGGVAGHSHKYFAGDHPGYFYRLQLVQNLSAVTAACLLVRKEVYDQVGGLNEDNLAVAFNDVDFCLKVREAGYRNLWTPHAELYHHESVSRGADDNPKKQARAQREVEYMRRTWGAQLDDDPAYNPNLTLNHEDFSLK